MLRDSSGEDMFFTSNNRSLRRGRRTLRRTETCRPCLVWPKDNPEMQFEGVVLDINPHGMCIRMLDALSPGMLVCVQMMRDEEFRDSLSDPLDAIVVRARNEEPGFVDHGIQIVQRPIKQAQSRPVAGAKRRTARRPTQPTRMHTLDVTVGDLGSRRTRR